MRFSELIKLLERNGFFLLKEKGKRVHPLLLQSLAMTGWFEWIIMALKKFPGTCHAILKSAGIKERDPSR
jgi:hypothetical protein